MFLKEIDEGLDSLPFFFSAIKSRLCDRVDPEQAGCIEGSVNWNTQRFRRTSKSGLPFLGGKICLDTVPVIKSASNPKGPVKMGDQPERATP